jgi:hypothetical protein
MKRTLAVMVTVELPDERITPAQLRTYVLEAVLSMRGSMDAREPIFQLPVSAFKVRGAKLS